MRIKRLWKLFETSNGDVEFTATPEAMDYFDETCRDIEERADKAKNDMLSTAIGRSEVHILKIAMLLEIGKQQVSTTIDIEMMQVACDMVTGYFIPCVMDVIERLEDDVKNNHIEKTISILRRLGGTATHTKLLRDSHLTSREFREATDTMIESRAVAVVTNAESKAKVYRLLSHTKTFDFRNVRRVRRVRTYTQPVQLNFGNPKNSRSHSITRQIPKNRRLNPPHNRYQ